MKAPKIIYDDHSGEIAAIQFESGIFKPETIVSNPEMLDWEELDFALSAIQPDVGELLAIIKRLHKAAVEAIAASE